MEHGARYETLAAQWSGYDGGGWEYLLPPAEGGHWLCVEASGGAVAVVAASLGGRLTVVPARPDQFDRLARVVEAVGARDARVVREMPAAGPFDGFLLHDLAGSLARGEVMGAIERARPLLAPGAFAYVAVRNRFGYSRLRRPAAGDRGAYFRPGDIAAALPGRTLALHPCICEPDGRLLDVVGAGGYTPAQNPGLRSERLRKALLGPRGARLIAPAFVAVASPPGAPANILETAVRELERRQGAQAGSFTVRRYHSLFGGKVVVSAGDAARRFILVFARAPVAIERRRREFALFDRLARLPAEVARHVPREEYQQDIAGARLFVMREIPGVTIEAVVPGLGTATREGAAFIERLHAATRQVVSMTAEDFDSRFGVLFHDAQARYPMLAARVEALHAAVRSRLAAAPLPLVWMHGDFKVENIMVDPASSRLEGVIDWELSDPEGLPFIDLWYLMAYDRTIRTGEQFFPAVHDLMPPGRMDPWESATCARYAAEMGIPDAAIPALAAAFVVHHCARRRFYDDRVADTMQRIAKAMDACLEWLAAPATRLPWRTPDA